MGSGRSTRCGRFAVLLAVLLACLLVPAVAGAKVTVPPGATEGDQYFEEAPNGGGSSSVDKDPGADGSAGGQPVAGTQALDQLGADGKAAAALANANRPPQANLDTNVPGKTPPAQPSSDTQGEGGMGFWFPLLIAVTAFAAIAYGLRRRLLPAH
jgi:hypothetical protein